MKHLAEEQKPLSISGLSRDARLHRKTVEKCVEMLSDLEKNWLDLYRIRLDTLDARRRIVSLQRRTGLLSYPEDVQNLIIKTQHFPRPSEETLTLIHLYLKDATTEEKAIPLTENDEIVRRLQKQGQIIKKKKIQRKEGNLFYLSKEGVIVAKGALRVFPELKQKQY